MKDFLEAAKYYGQDQKYILWDEGSVSYKTDKTIVISQSSSFLGTITDNFESHFIELQRSEVGYFLDSLNADDEESIIYRKLASTRSCVADSIMPSRDTFIHSILPQTYVFHIHPNLVKIFTTTKNGKEQLNNIFSDKVLWVDFYKNILQTSISASKIVKEHNRSTGKPANILAVENYGLFVAADSLEKIHNLIKMVLSSAKRFVGEEPKLQAVDTDFKSVSSISPALRMLSLHDNIPSSVVFTANKELLDIAEDKNKLKDFTLSLTNIHFSHTGDKILLLDNSDYLESDFKRFIKENKTAPKIVLLKNVGAFCIGADYTRASASRDFLISALKIYLMSEKLGGLNSRDFSDYKLKPEENKKRMSGKIAVITGAAQGFGQGIATGLAREGANVVIADLNLDGAKEAAEKLNIIYGYGTAIAVQVDVSKEKSVEEMIETAVVTYGGLDIIVSNAGIAIAGSLEEMTKDKFDLVTAINYTGYFLCSKYASVPMKIQHKYKPGYWTDIIEINSKSGLAGSNKNFAYAGSKFGGVGLTQSFALELVEYNIKVNAICPGNLLDGPLWSDPEKGLFKQYFEAGKVAGAKSIEDVRRHYESQVPMNRGCELEDVVRAVTYIVEQKYETGQALPVSGGQIMLK